MIERAADWEREGDCEAAMIVYQLAAQSDSEAAGRYARRYDPDTFEPSGCISAADAETAAYWYEAAAKAGDVNAQRQLGKILVEKYPSGVMRDQGESWLKRAAQAGDEQARALIDELGIGDN
jgi:TPR repeat protein